MPSTIYFAGLASSFGRVELMASSMLRRFCAVGVMMLARVMWPVASSSYSCQSVPRGTSMAAMPWPSCSFMSAAAPAATLQLAQHRYRLVEGVQQLDGLGRVVVEAGCPGSASACRLQLLASGESWSTLLATRGREPTM